jgi:hypothetical protein
MRLGPALIPVFLAVSATTAAGLAADSPLQVSREDCVRVVKHRPTPDTTYQPGIDSHGNPVAPADLEGSPVVLLPAVIPVLITVDLQKRFHLPPHSKLYEGNAGIGIATVDFDGNVTFNGSPLTDPEADALAAACDEALRH